MLIELTVNGETRPADIEPRTTLLDCLREQFGLTGAHAGCEHGVCGACTVLFDGVPVRSGGPALPAHHREQLPQLRGVPADARPGGEGGDVDGEPVHRFVDGAEPGERDAGAAVGLEGPGR